MSLEVRGRGQEWSPEAVDIDELKAGQLLLMLTELRALMYADGGGGGSKPTSVNISDNHSYTDELKKQVGYIVELINRWAM